MASKKMLPQEAANRLGTSVEFVRKCLRDGRYPFGTATKLPGSSRWTYAINRDLFELYAAGKLGNQAIYQP